MKKITLCLAVAMTVPLAGQSGPTHPIVAKASQYVGEFVARFSRVVAEERYVQDVGSRRGVPSTIAGQHRELRAEFLLVKADAAGGWIAFRDVFEVNRAAVRDHQQRLTKLFLESPSTAVAQAEAITRESARYNIGPQRTVNNPLLALAFLQDAYRSRFSFAINGQDRIDGLDVTVVEYSETMRPTLIRGSENRDVPARGRYWVDEQSGSVLKAEPAVDDGVFRSKIVVTF
jgi:hypothetical protein